MTSHLALSVEGLVVERGGRRVLNGVSFAARGGEVLAALGPNGTGKTTLLRALAGLLPLIAGRIRLDPPDAADADTPLGERAHFLGHADALKGALTPVENLRFAAATLGRPALSPVAALDRFALGHAAHLPTAYLSAGQRRRVALARLLVATRPVWLLDEPGTSLDTASSGLLADAMRDHLAAGGLIVAATHAPLGVPTRELRLEPV